jgi:hypothetical protein
MQIFKNGRDAYLDFLRNLTPQAVIFSIALISGYGLEPTCCYPENLMKTMVFFVFLSMGMAAVWVNSSRFIEKYLVSADILNKVARRLQKNGVKGFRNLRGVLKYSWRKERIIFVEVVVVFVIIEFGLVIVIFSAINAATTMFKNIH